MPRTLTTAAQDLIAEPVGVEPIVIIEIEWVAGTTVSYADKDMPGILGKILQVSDLDEVIKLDVGSTTANISVQLSDTDGTIKALMDKYDLHKRPCRVLQCFEGLTLADAFELFRGEVASPIVWNEGTRDVSFNVISRIYSIQAGFAPEEGQYQYTPIDLVGRPWPMCFGSPIHVPATKARSVVSGTVMNMFGIPDATLKYKKKLLLFIQQTLKDAYQYYINMLDIIENTEKPSYQIQEEYAHHIVNHDAAKQTVEDLTENLVNVNKQIEELTNDYMEENGGVRSTLITQINTLKVDRDKQYETLTNLRKQSKSMELEADGYKKRLETVKWKINTINKIRKKIRAVLGDYYKNVKQVDDVTTAINDQSTLTSSATIVMAGTEFPQLQTINLEIDKLVVSGSFNGYDLSNIVPQPSYVNIVFGPRLDDDVTAFWLTDASTDLTGKYIRLSDNKIVKVSGQSGKKVNVELPRKPRNPRLKKREIDYEKDQKIKDAFNETLGRLLTGFETPDQISEIANQIPRDISPKILDILSGGNKTLIIELRNHDPEFPDNAPKLELTRCYFNLIYNGEEVTSNILFSDDADTIKDKILASTLSIDSNDLTVEIVKWWVPGEFWRRVEVKYSSLMRRLALHFSQIDYDLLATEPKLDKLLADLVLSYEVDEPVKTIISYNRDCYKKKNSGRVEGPITIYYKGKGKIWAVADSFGSPLPVANGEDIVTYLEEQELIEPGTIIGSGGPLEDSDIVFEHTDTYSSFYIDYSGVKFGWAATSIPMLDGDGITGNPVLDDDGNPIIVDGTVIWVATDAELDALGPYAKKEKARLNRLLMNALKNKNIKPSINVITEGGGAHQYTVKERDKKLKDIVDRDVNAPSIDKYRDQVHSAIKTIRESKKNGSFDESMKEDLFNSLAAYRSIAMKIPQTGFINDEVYKLISDEEFGLLYDMEVTGYLEWRNKLSELDIDFPDDIDYQFTMKEYTEAKEACTIILPKWLEYLDALDEHERLHETFLLPQSTQLWLAQIGDVITLAGAYQEKFVANIMPSTVKAVYAKRNIGGLTRMTPVPSSFYLKNENESFGAYNCTTILLSQPLKVIDANWGDEIYVTLESSVGPNVCDVIQFIVERYTTLTIDTDTFAHVKDLQTNYPVNFAVLDKQDAMSLCEDIAWQARCVIWIKLGKVYIRYLPEEPTPYKTITRDDIEQASFGLTFTTTEEIITKLDATWRTSYAQDKLFKMTIRRNLNRYNEVSDTREIYIYNDRQLVYKSATWWSMMRGSTWKKVSFKLFHNNLDLETQDCILLDRSSLDVSTEAVKAIIEKATYNSADSSIQVEAWLPILSGQMEPYIFAWPMLITDVYPLTSEVTEGNAGNPANFNTPDSFSYTPPSLTDQFADRPPDMGTHKLSDGADDLPKNPANEFTEMDYVEVSVEPLNTDLGEAADVEEKVPEFTELSAKIAEKEFGVKPTFTAAGYVSKQLDDVETRGEDITDGLPSRTIKTSLYTINLLDGNKMTARCINVKPEDTLPNQLPVLVVWDDSLKEYVFIAPTFSAPEEVPDF